MSDTKAKIVEALDALPEDRQREVLDFVESLRSREDANAEEREPDPEENPLLDFIGGVEHGSLAQDIDEALYEEEL
ncbi:MAG: hypothetical protein BRD27_01920 [Bacteroidetes bacterium QH_10_64_19]|nr:MAG: hypothetical protein BRD27_01920 [Bacteroidetes bacterium QH_10_64_19]PSQ76708.1 MAG: hypothetical protein BRD33_02855 [Bacteroidetes bacterium QH_6_63_17]